MPGKTPLLAPRELEQAWRCYRCRSAGSIVYPVSDDCAAVFQSVEEAHAISNTACAEEHGSRHIALSGRMPL